MHEPVDQVEVYEKLKPKLDDSETKLLLQYMEEVTRGAAVSKDLKLSAPVGKPLNRFALDRFEFRLRGCPKRLPSLRRTAAKPH